MSEQAPRCPSCPCAIHEGGPCGSIWNCYPTPDQVWEGTHRCHCDRTHPEVAAMIERAREVYGVELRNFGGLTSEMNWSRKSSEELDEMRRKTAGNDPKMLKFYGLRPKLEVVK